MFYQIVMLGLGLALGWGNCIITERFISCLKKFETIEKETPSTYYFKSTYRWPLVRCMVGEVLLNTHWMRLVLLK